MQKIDSLREGIVAAIPELATDPARLRLWIDRGTARSTMSRTQGFGFYFRLNVLVLELSTDIAVLALALFRWLRVNQPELLAPGADGFNFEADILDNGTADVLILLDLTQNVAVTANDDGSFTLADLPEPDPMFADELGFGGTDPVPTLTAVSVVGEGEILPDALPD